MVFTIDTLKFIVTYNAGTSMWLLEIEFSYSFGVMLWLKINSLEGGTNETN